MTAFEHCRTALSAIVLSLTGLEEGDLAPPLDRTNLQHLRDALEVGTLLSDSPVHLPRADMETVALCLLATRGVLDDGTPLNGMPDLLETLTPPRVEAALRWAMDELDSVTSFSPRLLNPNKGPHHA